MTTTGKSEVVAWRIPSSSAKGWFVDDAPEAADDHGAVPLVPQSLLLDARADNAQLQYALEQSEAACTRAEALAGELRNIRELALEVKRQAISNQSGGITRGSPSAISNADAIIQRIDAAIGAAKGNP